MIIPVHTDGQKLEYFLVELQGTLQSAEVDALDGQTVGAISVRNKIPYMVVGRHQLQGEVKGLKAPLAVMQKLVAADAVPATPSATPAGGSAASGEGAASGGGEVSYSIVGFVRRKIIFKQRPLPMVMNGESSLSKRARAQ